jgi:hypothetical protein
MNNILKKLPKPMGLGFLLLGVLLLIRPRQLGPLFGVDTTKRAGLILVRVLAVREMLTGGYILLAKDSKALKRGILARMLAETSDFFMHMFGKGIFLQPISRRVGYMVPPVLLVEYLIRRSVEEKPGNNHEPVGN